MPHLSKTFFVVLISICLLPFAMDAVFLTYCHDGVLPGYKIEPSRLSDGRFTLEPRLLQPGDPLDSRYTARMSETDLHSALGEEPALLIHRLNGQGYRVYLNGMLIGEAGDPDGGRANIWNAAYVFPIDPGLIQAQNELVMEIHHEYDAGIDGLVLFTDMDSAMKVLGFLSLATGALSYIGIGMALCGGIMVLLLVVLNQRKRSPLIYMVLSLIALALYALDYTQILRLPVSYLVYKKIVILMLFLAMAGTSMTISKLFRRNLPMIINLTALGLISIAAAVSRDMITFKWMYQICMALIPFTITSWLIVVVPGCKEKEEARIFLYGLLMFILIGTYNIVVLFLFPGLLSGSIFPYTIVYMAIVILLMNLDIRRKNETIQQESSRRFHFYRKAITDGLTGLFNREYMISKLENETPPYAVAMLDIDHFKEINDTYGHQAGDRMIQFAGRLLTSTLRDTDYVGRYGGDEFIVILHSTEPSAYSVMERFRADIARQFLDLGEHIISITFSIGVCYAHQKESADHVLQKADRALYLAKENGRNMVCVYE